MKKDYLRFVPDDSSGDNLSFSAVHPLKKTSKRKIEKLSTRKLINKFIEKVVTWKTYNPLLSMGKREK